MKTYERFIIHNERFSVAYIMGLNYDLSLASYVDLFKEIKKDFPWLKESNCRCHVVLESGWCKGQPVITFEVRINQQKNGWKSKEKLVDVVLSH